MMTPQHLLEASDYCTWFFLKEGHHLLEASDYCGSFSKRDTTYWKPQITVFLSQIKEGLFHTEAAPSKHFIDRP